MKGLSRLPKSNQGNTKKKRPCSSLAGEITREIATKESEPDDLDHMELQRPVRSTIPKYGLGKKSKHKTVEKRFLTSMHWTPICSMAFLCAIFLFLTVSFQTISGHETKTVYEVLEEYDFPIGILPKGVTGYELNNSTGKFSVYLNSTCTFKIDSYELKYKTTVTGVITKDKLSSLSGVQVKVFFFWLNIVQVTRDDDELEFSVGIASANFPVSNFDECPTCGCGFDCNGDELEKLKLNGHASSS